MYTRLATLLILCCLPFFASAQTAATDPQVAEAADTARVSDDPVRDLLRILQDDSARTTIIEAIKENEQTALEATTVVRSDVTDADEPEAKTVEQLVSDKVQALNAWFENKLNDLKNGFKRIWLSLLTLYSLSGSAKFWTGIASCLPLAIVGWIGYRVASNARERLATRFHSTERSDILSFSFKAISFAFVSITFVVCVWLVSVFVSHLDFSKEYPRVARSFLSASIVFSVCLFVLNLFTKLKYRSDRDGKDANSTVDYATVAAWLARTLGFIVYGQIWFIAVAKYTGGFKQGQYLYSILSIFALLWVGISAFKYRRQIDQWLTSTISDRVSRRGGRLFSRWYLLVWGYCIWLAVVAVTQPGNALPPILLATAKVAAICAVMAAILIALGRVSKHGVTLPDELQRQFPRLSQRLDGLLRSILIIVRAVVLFSGFVWVLEIVNLPFFDPSEVASSVGGAIENIERILIIGLISSLLWIAFNSWSEYFVDTSINPRSTGRQRTLLALFKNVINIVLVIITGMLILSELGVNIAPLLASAGVLGLAVGFGAQRLVQDVITGIFIQIEDVMQIGDVVTLGDITGTVEKLTIRSVSLRDKEGNFHLVSFSQTDTITNYQRDFAFAFLEIAVDYREDLEKVEHAMREAFDVMQSDPNVSASILDELAWFGVQEYNDARMVVRVRIKTIPGDQWMVRRAYNAAVKHAFEKNEIRLGSPVSRVLYEEDLFVTRVGNPSEEQS